MLVPVDQLMLLALRSTANFRDMVDSLPPSTRDLTSLLTRLYGATGLHNDSMGANEDHESVMTLVNVHSHAQMIYSISVTAHMPSFPVVCLCLQPLEDSVRVLMAISKECPNGGPMLWRDETISVPGVVPKDQVSSSRIGLKTVVQAQSTIFIRIGKTSPGDQTAATAPATLRRRLAERQGDLSSHGVGRKYW